MAAPNFQMKVTAPQLRKDAIRTSLLNALDKQGRKLVKEFEKTTRTWEGDKPTFEPLIEVKQGTGAGLSIGLGGGKGVDKWIWLNFGTAVRYAILSYDWKSKTTPGVLGSGPGQGRVVKIDVNNPQPGIEARDWSKIIMRDFKPVFGEAMREALADGLAKAKEG